MYTAGDYSKRSHIHDLCTAYNSDKARIYNALNDIQHVSTCSWYCSSTNGDGFQHLAMISSISSHLYLVYRVNYLHGRADCTFHQLSDSKRCEDRGTRGSASLLGRLRKTFLPSRRTTNDAYDRSSRLLISLLAVERIALLV